MFSRNTYLIPSSHHHPRPTTSVFDLDGVDVLLHQQQQHHHHQQQQQHPGVYLDNNATFFNNGGGLNGGGQPCSSSGVVHHEPKAAAAAAKKDRHSKIHTAQGPRDRRVRLSIGIARKFFDLQEMLGFDKPSKTLDWLLTKSKEAIEELLQQTKQKDTASGSSPSDDQCEQLDFEGGSADWRRRHNKAGAGKEPHQQQQQQAKESRAKARARARERTLEKMCFKQLGGGGGATTRNTSDLNVNELEFLQLSAAGAGKTTTATTTTTRAGFPHHLPLSNEGDLIEESIFIKRKSKNPSSSVLGFQQNLVFSRDLNSNHMIPSSANYSNENWDVFGFSSQSNLHAIFDQHRFINSNSNI